jgi:hypothetical protein
MSFRPPWPAFRLSGSALRETNRILIASALIALTLGAGWVRIRDIESKSISHPEMWAPLIPLPEDLADPPERPGPGDVLRYSLGTDTHPPGYSLFLWAWMSAFGHSLWAIRLPSVLLGAGTIPALWWLGRLLGVPSAGWIAAILLSLNGYHAAWSGFGRMYAAACLLGVLSSALLLKLMRGEGGRVTMLAYFTLTLAGLSVHVYLWPILLAQIVWVLWTVSYHRQPLPNLWGLQVLTAICGTPLLTFAAFQRHHQVATLAHNPWRCIAEVVSFAFAVPVNGNSDLFAHGTTLPAGSAPAHMAASLLGFLLLAIGLAATPNTTLRPVPVVSWRLAWYAAASAACSVSGFFLWRVRNVPDHPGCAPLLPVPFLFAASASLLLSRWPRCPRIPIRPIPAPVAFAAGPIGLLLLFSLYRPIFLNRAFLILAPYVLLLLAIGLSRLWKSSRLAAASTAAAILAIHLHGIVLYRHLTIDPIDFAAFSTILKPRMQASDLVFVRRSWHGTPVLFYIAPRDFRIFAGGFQQAVQT